LIRLSRLAVDISTQGQGIGSRLLVAAFEKAIQAAEIFGIYALIVAPIDEKAADFYKKHGFIELKSTGALFISLRKIRDAFLT
jgi:ribosomal protein S18 acetylase RimI-like enzyme